MKKPHPLTPPMLASLATVLSTAWAEDLNRPYLTVPRTATAPIIDGNLNDEAWKDAACQPFLFDTANFLPAEPVTRTFFDWDDERMYVAYECAEPDPGGIMFRKKGQDAGSLDDDDSTQLFLQSPGMELYYRFVINTGGFVFDEHHYDPAWNCDAHGAAQLGDHVWTAEMSIPWSGIGGPPSPGQVWRANLSRHRLVGGNTFTQWSRTGPEARMPHRFGSLRFVDAAPAIHQLELGYELPGMNKLTANVRGTTDGVSLRVRHAEDEPGVTAIHLQDKTGKEVELLYPISSHTGERLVVKLADADKYGLGDSPPSPPEIAGATLTDQLGFVFTGEVTGLIYELECSDNETNYVKTGALVRGNGAEQILYDPRGTPTQAFYRIVDDAP